MEYRGCKVTQSPKNNHIIVSKDGRAIAHIPCKQKKNNDELKEVIDFILEMRERAAEVYTNKDSNE